MWRWSVELAQYSPRNAFETNADLECRAGVLSWLRICLNASETNAELECRAGVLSWLSIRRNIF
ncbi:hypothetical protein DPMN_155328 [Dreissena polymorpha]|uniref:Uncharacterized protein n=1 Tax=Dreissena polymorpha TaxID=45954 RepID=A0A9D4FMS5_DREPO|nr:hypothetical protein DPMN_155328 [Dreissena polymorpha]